MKKYFNTLIPVLGCLMTVSLGACSDDDIPNSPKAIDVNTIELTPTNGGCLGAWTPDPADSNFVFLNVSFTDHDGKARAYNVSRYGSALVTPEVDNGNGELVPNTNGDAVTFEIKDLINQEYSLHFYAFNDQNQKINLGTRVVTPLDYTQCMPDSIYAVSIKTLGKKQVVLEWKELPLKTSSTLQTIRFVFTHKGSEEVVNIDFKPGVRRDTITLEEEGIYSVAYKTLSAAGKEWVKASEDIEVLDGGKREYWTAEDKAGWSVTGSSVEEQEGPYSYLIDGDINKFWSASWGNSSMPVTLDVTFGKVMNVYGVLLQQRQNCSTPSWHRCVKKFSIYVKENLADPWEKYYEGEFPDNEKEAGGDHLERFEFGFNAPVRAGFVRISIDQEMFPEDGAGLVCMAEFGIIELL